MATNNSVLKIGTILDSGSAKYRVTDVLGQGGFGITYLVMGELKVGNVTTEAKFAVKEHYPSLFCRREQNEVIPLDDKLSEYTSSKADFVAEAKKLHALGTQNDNIVKVNEVFESNGTAYYVMQYINGESLSTYVKAKGRLKYSEATSLLLPILDAVEFLHRSRINHLDIKPDNIMLHDSLNGTVPVLIDFGLSVHFKKNGDKTSPKGVQGVSEGYSPLEQYAGVKEFIPATDIYSLVTTLLYTLTGETPKSAADIRLSDVRAMLNNIVPSDAIDGICKALCKSYEDRTSSISVLKSDLGICGSGGGGTATSILNIKDDTKKKSKLIPIVILAVVIAIGSGVFLWMNSGKASEMAETNDNQSDVPEAMAEEISTATDSTVEATEHDAKLETPEPKQELTPANNEAQAPQQQPEAPVQSTPQKVVTSGTLSLGYGTWTGGIKNGRPDGQGKIVFSTSHTVDRSSSYEANPGDYFIATYSEGNLINGKLYDADGNLLKTIIP